MRINAAWTLDLGDDELFDALTEVVSRAALEVVRRCEDGIVAREKVDQTPVTSADLASEAMLLEGMAKLLPQVPVLCEEAGTKPAELNGSFLVIDPLDGTKELIAGSDEFTVNLAYVREHRAVLGIIAAPARSLIWRGRSGGAAEKLQLAPGQPPRAADHRETIGTRAADAAALVAITSRSHADPATEQFLAELAVERRIFCGSALKFCRLAEGHADIYPRLSPTSEWDVAAGDAILRAAGGVVQTLQREPIRYGQAEREFRVPSFIACGDKRLQWPHVAG